ncbi:hypothetical protein V5N11_013047 [Cardamine amara subsp. amara]|uniref:ATP-dependent DNA helicase n=1 Tax=Cardamine amara subsp. amara TaxID=228776 RepID=A0ABD1A7H3_CARAN
MALNRKPYSSVPLDMINPWKIKMQIIRMSKGNKKESDNLIEMVLLDSSGTRIHTTIDEAFSKWFMNIGNEKINEPKTEIDILEDLLITECKDPIKTIVRQVYGESFPQSFNPEEKAILCHTDVDVNQINDYMLSQLSDEESVCYSADSITPSHSSPDDYMLYPMELLNSIKVPGLPSHILKLKVGAIVMLLKDLDRYGGLCKGTRLQITRLNTFVLEARFIAGNKNGEKVLIPRVPSFPTDANFPIKMQRRQFPLTLAFAMSINESQGQSLSKVGLYLPRRVFSHGQMYVAISKVKSRDGLKILITDKDGKPQEETMNVVFKEVSQII